MIIRLSVQDAVTREHHAVEVTAEPASSVASLLGALPILPGGRRCYVGDQQLEPDATFADSPIVSGVVISVGGPGPDPRAQVLRSAGALRIIAGPDAGRAAWLGKGTHLLGGDDAAAIRLRDPAVAGRLARLEVDAAGKVTVTDLGSKDGTTTSPIAGKGAIPLTPGAVLQAGQNRLEWVPLPSKPLQVTRSPDGLLDFNREFAPAPTVERGEILLPSPVNATRNVGALVASGLVPVIMGGVMAAATQQAVMLLFALLGPATAGATHLMERRQRAEKQRTFATGKRNAEAQIVAKVATEERQLRRLAPDKLDLSLAATGAGPGLWPRNAHSPDGLVLRVGTADKAASIDLRGEPWPGLERPVLRSVPMTVDLRSTGVLGVVGPAEPVNALLRWLLIQLGTLRGPADLRLVIVTSVEDAELAWAGWLPHVDAGEGAPFPCWVGNTRQTRAARIAGLAEIVAARMAQRRTAADVRYGEEIVAVLDGALALRHFSGMAEVLRDGPSVGVYVICADRRAMNECRGLCELEGSTMRLTRSREDHARTVRPEVMNRAQAAGLARCLTPMRDRLVLGGAETAVPHPVRFLDLLRVGVPASDDVLALWADRPGPTTAVAIGADGSGPVTVDLAQQGPHTMLGGATGAGKSILLQTLVTSLLLANRPDELNLVLVDFKGGSAFLPFERCPQVVGLIRSTGETPADVFDEAAANRVLASVRAEVRRRESLLARFGGEIDEYWRSQRAASPAPPLPRLVMIFDEFARVLEVSPNFLKELVNVAAKGRSLGMHLVLATQSLQGKLSPELKNNIDLRITLRQNEPADSVEVLGVPDAATIPGRLRGRGMILCTKDEARTPRTFQSGYLGDPPPAGGAAPASVRIVEWPAFGAPRPEDSVDHGDADTDLTLTLRAIEKAGHRLNLARPRRPLLPPLPAELPLEDLADWATTPIPTTAVPFGLVDDPAAQEQPAAWLDLAGTERLLIAGGSESGRTTLVRSLITGLVTRFSPDQAHVYTIEHQPGGLAAYDALPHCGGVFSAGEPDRIRRFVSWLDREVQQRRVERLGIAGVRRPWLLILIDGWEQFENRSDPAFVETSLLATLRDIITAGAPVGVHLVAVGGQDMMSGKLPNLYSRRLLLPFPKEENRKMHLPGGVVTPPVLPGRAVDAGTGFHVQVCQPRSSAEDLIARSGVGLTAADPSRLPRRFPTMPARIRINDLIKPDPPPSPSWIPLGVGGFDVATVGVDLFDAGPHLMLVSGPSGSGRTTAAATLAHGLRRAGVGVLAIASPRSPLPRLLPDDEGVQLIRALTVKDADLRDTASHFEDGPYAVILDDCEQITVIPSEEGFSDAPTLLQDIVRPEAFGRQALILVGDALPILYGQRRSLMRVVDEIKTAGIRVLLTPTNLPGAREHGFTLEADQFLAGPPGRGYLLAGRTASLVQFAVS